MGVVYLAEDTTLKRRVAIKFLPSRITVNETDKARFLQEAQAAAAINHPNVCVIHEIKFQEESPYIVMEFINGKTLRDHIRASGQETHSTSDIIDYAIQIAEALHAAHEKNIIQQYIPDISSELLHILDRTLEKDPETRYQTIKEALIDLRRIKRDSERVSRRNIPPAKDPTGKQKPNGKTPKIKPKSILNLKTLGVTLTVFMLIVLLIIYFPIGKEQVISQPAKHTQITFTGKARSPEISPDGSFIAYISSETPDKDKLIVQDLSGGKPLTIFSNKHIQNIRWTPDGSNLSVMAIQDSSSALFIIPRLGGESRKDTFFGFHTWSPDGSKYAGTLLTSKQIRFIDKGSARADKSIDLTGDFTWIHGIDWSPSNDNLHIFTTKQEEHIIWTIRTDGGHQQKVLIDSVFIQSPRWSSDGSAIYYLRPDVVRDSG